jgi:outer membrane protein OmpA-like peptidoglycan-associated protein
MTNRSLALWCVLALLLAPVVAPAGIGDSIKKKAQDKANKTADDALNKKPAEKADETQGAGEASAESSPQEAAGEAKVSTVSTKFDFVPGDKVLLFDDFSQDELGDFPAHWKLNAGNVETAEMDGERWLRLAGDYGRVRPKVEGTLPEYWTLEFDMHIVEPACAGIGVEGLVEGNVTAWKAELHQYGATTVTFQSGAITSQSEYEGVPSMVGRHHVMIMARQAGLKIYVDTQRVVNVPDAASLGRANEVQINFLDDDCEPKITNVRFAEGNKPTKDPFANGKFVTYGIYFDSGSDVVKPESAPVLRQLAAYMEANAAVKVAVDGHTDNEGNAAGNLDLSKRRAASVAKVLAEQFKIAPDRFQTDGLGDTKPVASNDNAEGRAMNRRVEFTKL